MIKQVRTPANIEIRRGRALREAREHRVVTDRREAWDKRMAAYNPRIACPGIVLDVARLSKWWTP